MSNIENNLNSFENNQKNWLRRLDIIYKKFGLDPNEEIDFSDEYLLIQSSDPKSQENKLIKLNALKEMIMESNSSDDDYKIEETLTSWENNFSL